MNHNFCRVADPADPRQWCYTNDTYVRFDYCDCGQQMCHGNAGTVTMPISFAYGIYDSHASEVNLMLDGTSLDNLQCGGTVISPTVRFEPQAAKYNCYAAYRMRYKYWVANILL